MGSGPEQTTRVDLVHDAAPQVVGVADKPQRDGLRVDPIRELRANKLSALLGRSETKDLVDLWFLDKAGQPALEGMADATLKDAGLDPATLAWVLSSLRVDVFGLLLDEPVSEAELIAYRDRLVADLQRLAWPRDP